ncbi:MAG: isoamylase early set domain-containing protein [Nitrospira defluvii]|nr:isoamylase early set domain-containing protein [Nitrospira defluvii]
MMRILASLTVLTWLVGCAAAPVQVAPTPVSGGVRFVVSVPTAETVAVVGSFNGWSSTAHVMTRVGSNGSWSTVVSLSGGEHAFMYLVDGKTWVVPPAAEDFVTDGFGNTNGVVIVP